MNRDCELCRELLPWYAVGVVGAAERIHLEEHLESCAECRAEWAQVAELARAVQETLRELPSPGERVWGGITARVQPGPLARVDVGSFLLGVSVWLTVRGRHVLLGGDLRLLGRKYRLFAEEA